MSTGVIPTSRGASQLVVRAVADEEALRRLDAELPGGKPVDRGIGLRQPGRRREDRSVEEMGKARLRPHVGNLLGAVRDETDAKSALAQLDQGLGEAVAPNERAPRQIATPADELVDVRLDAQGREGGAEALARAGPCCGAA